MTDLEKYVNFPKFVVLKEEEHIFKIILKASSIMSTPDGGYVYISEIDNRVVPSEYYVILIPKGVWKGPNSEQ